MTNKEIVFLPQVEKVAFSTEESVLEVALRAGVQVPHSCGGMGTCTTCRVYIESCPTPLPERNEVEKEIAEPRGFADNERLCCQLEPIAGMIVRIPPPLSDESED